MKNVVLNMGSTSTAAIKRFSSNESKQEYISLTDTDRSQMQEVFDIYVIIF